MDYEKELESMQKKNEVYLQEFQKWLKDKGLVEKTIRNHLSNVDLYINDYLNYYEITKMQEGCYSLSSFLGDWFIRKCMWSTGSTVKTTAASIKKFYQCMLELGHIEKDDYEFLYHDIKENIDDWVESVEAYNSGDDSFFDIF